jgi:L-fuculose-phosphate aldolase
MADRQLIAGTDGNISVRLGPDRIMVTPTGRHKGKLTPENMVVVDLRGFKVEGDLEASSELAMHLFVYQSRPDVGACVHGHPPHATAYAITGQVIPSGVLPEAVVSIEPIAHTPFAPPGTEAVAESLEAYVFGHNAFLMRNHGLLTIGRDLTEAYNRHETVEHSARIMYLAGRVGEINKLPAEEIKRLANMRKKPGERPDWA